MGLSYLSKKSWHPSTFKNIEVVWAAEQKKKDEERRYQDHLKKLKEERDIEEMRQLQAANHTIPASHAQRLEWMYQAKPAQNQTNLAQTSEDYLLGKQVKDVGKKEEGGFKIVPVIRGSTYATPENEAFVKMMEDPLVYIKQKEQEARSQVYENPLKMKQIREEIEALKKGKKKDKKKDKKHKKHKKEKKHKKQKRSQSSDESDDGSRSARRHGRVQSGSSEDERTKDRSYKRDSDYHSEKSSRHHRSRSRSDERRRERHHRSRSPRDRSDQKSRIQDIINRKPTQEASEIQSKDLGPDMKLYAEKQRQLEIQEQLRKKQKPAYDVNALTQEEIERKVLDMQNYAKKQDEDRNLKLFGSKTIPETATLQAMTKEQESSKKDARFLKDLNRQAYMDSGLTLDERISRNKHYIGRDAKDSE